MRAGLVLAGRYVLDELVGRGNVGEVWRGTDRELDRQVAVKVVRDRIEDPKLAAGFQREARIAGSLRHRGIAVVYDVGEQDGQPFIVMEPLHGQDLAAVLKDEPAGLPAGQAISLVIQAAEALQAAHDGGVIHRDLKPANLFLEDDGQLKICDFGIAVATDAASVIASSYILGTPAYMSPEQCDGAQADERSDLYSLGCVLYALLTGQPPFPAGFPLAVMAQHRNVTPASLRQRNPGLPAELDQLVLRLLAKDPAERLPDAASLAAALKDLQGSVRPAGYVVSRPVSQTARPSARRAPASALRGLLEGPHGIRDLLGLLTVARDGLTLAGLEELTGHTDLASYEIQAVLRDGAGAIFAASTADWQGEQIYTLANDALRAEAVAALGAGLLAGYRERLCQWARHYQEQRWPATTPGYLLSGYPRMLRDSGETARLIACVTDPARHDRMFILRGGDGAALAELTLAQDLVLAQADPDLHAMARLVVHLRDLVDRDAVIPADLPAVWIALSQLDRGEALAGSITGLHRRAHAQAAVAAALTETGQRDRAQRAAALAQATARSILEPAERAQALADVAATSGTARKTGPVWPASSLTAGAADLARAGRYQEAGDAARSVVDPVLQAQVLTAVAWAMIAAGYYDQAKSMATDAETAIRSVTNRGRDYSLADVTVALACAGRTEEAARLARGIGEPRAQSRAQAGIAYAGSRSAAAPAGLPGRAPLLASIAADLARTGLRAQAETAGAAAAADAVSNGHWNVLAQVGSTLASAGLRDHAIRTFVAARKALTAADPTSSPAAVVTALAEAGPGLRAATGRAAWPHAYPRGSAAPASPRSVDVRMQLAEAGSAAMASSVAKSVIRRAGQQQNVAELARIALDLADAGYAAQADAVARSITTPQAQAQVLADIGLTLTQLAWTHACYGRRERAERIVRSITEPWAQAQTLADVALALSIADSQKQAWLLADSIIEPQARARGRADLALVLSAAGGLKQAWTIAHSIDIPQLRARALAGVASALVGARQTAQAARAAEAALAAAGAIGDPVEQVQTLATLAAVLTEGRLTEAAAHAAVTAEATARVITDPAEQAPALTAAASALVGLRESALAASYQRRARSLIALAWTKGPWELPLYALSSAAPQVLDTITSLLASP